MKSRELVVWCILLVVLALLLRQCNSAVNTISTPTKILVKGKTDTIIQTKTKEIIRYVDKPIPIYVYLDTTTKVDSIRVYNDSLVSSDGIAHVKTTVQGSLLNQKIGLQSFRHDTTFSRVDTLIITRPTKWDLSAMASVDLNNGPGFGGIIEYNRVAIGYQYYPLTRSNQFVVKYSLFKH